VRSTTTLEVLAVNDRAYVVKFTFTRTQLRNVALHAVLPTVYKLRSFISGKNKQMNEQ